MIDSAALAERGYVVAPRLIEPDLCHSLAQIWPDQARFRSHIVMQRHGVGQGDAAIFAVNERPVKGTRFLPHGHAARRVDGMARPALHARHHLPRRSVRAGVRQPALSAPHTIATDIQCAQRAGCLQPARGVRSF
jgi:hypothetical protein